MRLLSKIIMTLSKDFFLSIKNFLSQYNKIYFALISTLMIMLPLWKKTVPFVIILLVITWIVEGNFKNKFIKLRENFYPFIIFVSLFLFYIFGLTYTTNYSYAFFDIEVKLSLLVFPLLFFSGTFNFIDRNKLTILLLFLILACFLSSFISLIISTIQYIKTDSTIWFYYVNINFFHHPSYISMFIEFSLAAIAYLFFNNSVENKILKILLLLLSGWFLIYIILLSSKAGFIGLIFIFLIIFYQLIIKHKIYRKAIIYIIGSFLVIVIGYKIIPQTNNRISPAIEVIKKADYDVNAEDGTVQRIEIWKTSIEIIKNNFFFGVGTGDVKDELLSNYQKKGMKFAYDNNLNAHGQYFQTTISLGFIGFIALFFGLFYPFLLSLRKRNFLYLSFIILIALNISVESMFENQAGVVFYAFLNSFLFITLKIKPTNKNFHD